MKDLTKKLIPLVLAGAGIIGCATSPVLPNDYVKSEPISHPIQNSLEAEKGSLIDLRNEYFARTYKAADTIDLISSALLSEVILKKTENGYTKRTTGLYAGEEIWNSTFNQSCKFADANNDYILEENEVNDLLDLTYDAIEKRNHEVIWAEE